VLLGPEVRHTRFFINRNNIPKNCDIHCYNRENFTSHRTILIYIEKMLVKNAVGKTKLKKLESVKIHSAVACNVSFSLRGDM
jgi:hypothetical protein